MTASARIILTGSSREDLLKEVATIRAWDKGSKHPIQAAINDHHYVYDSIDNVEAAIKTDLSTYINEKFPDRNKILKSGGNDDLYMVDHPDRYNDKVFKRKIRKPQPGQVGSKFSPKKKKRK